MKVPGTQTAYCGVNRGMIQGDRLRELQQNQTQGCAVAQKRNFFRKLEIVKERPLVVSVTTPLGAISMEYHKNITAKHDRAELERVVRQVLDLTNPGPQDTIEETTYQLNLIDDCTQLWQSTKVRYRGADQSLIHVITRIVGWAAVSQLNANRADHFQKLKRAKLQVLMQNPHAATEMREVEHEISRIAAKEFFGKYADGEIEEKPELRVVGKNFRSQKHEAT